jgi:hypothetical protein
VLKYLTGYTHRVALSNHRLVRLQDDRVTFTWKDYGDGCRRKEMTLDAVEFVRRFALHIVPKGMVRIRQYGLLAHRDRTERLALCRSLVEARVGPTLARANEPSSPPARGQGGDAPSPDGVALGSSAAPVEPNRSSSQPGLGLLAALVSLFVAAGATAPSASAAAIPSAAVVVDDRCPDCGAGRVHTIWRAGRPSWEERQRIPILDSS